MDNRGISSHKQDLLYSGFTNDLGLQVGEVSRCSDTVLMGLLVEERYPTGLVRRQMPSADHKALARCELGGRQPARLPWYLAY
ncbi:MAG: hypothetical protein R2827_14350 [Bdellovibrionales bacterium]